VLASQSGASFSGSAILTATIAGGNFVVNASSLSGTVTPGGQISGPFAFQTFANGAPFGSGTGTYTSWSGPGNRTTQGAPGPAADLLPGPREPVNDG
jgi:hypothetical protein